MAAPRSARTRRYGAYTTTGATGSAAGLNPFRTAGAMYDRTTGWIKYGQRWYNPATGRFTQQDSIERLTNPQEGNRYAYAADNPGEQRRPQWQVFSQQYPRIHGWSNR